MSKINNRYGLHYLKFLSLVQAVRALPSFPSLDPVEERLLNLFATVWHTGQKITVLQAMSMAVDMSSTTAHRRLKTLRQKGVISLEMDAADNRIKYVVATPVVERYFSELGQCVGLACADETVSDPN
jgi:DNA-binding MarR family transcriptional regulator